SPSQGYIVRRSDNLERDKVSRRFCRSFKTTGAASTTSRPLPYPVRAGQISNPFRARPVPGVEFTCESKSLEAKALGGSCAARPYGLCAALPRSNAITRGERHKVNGLLCTRSGDEAAQEPGHPGLGLVGRVDDLLDADGLQGLGNAEIRDDGDPEN